MEANIFVDGIEIHGTEDKREIYLLSLVATQRNSQEPELVVKAHGLGTGERSESVVSEPIALLSVREDTGFLAMSLAVVAVADPDRLQAYLGQWRGHPALVGLAGRISGGEHASSGPVAMAVRVFLNRFCGALGSAGIATTAMHSDLEMASVLDLQDSFEWSQGDSQNWCKLLMRCSLQKDLPGVEHPTRWADVEIGAKAYYKDLDGEMLHCTVALVEPGSALLIEDPDGQGEQREFHVERLKDFWISPGEGVQSTPKEQTPSLSSIPEVESDEDGG